MCGLCLPTLLVGIRRGMTKGQAFGKGCGVACACKLWYIDCMGSSPVAGIFSGRTIYRWRNAHRYTPPPDQSLQTVRRLVASFKDMICLPYFRHAAASLSTPPPSPLKSALERHDAALDTSSLFIALLQDATAISRWRKSFFSQCFVVMKRKYLANLSPIVYFFAR